MPLTFRALILRVNRIGNSVPAVEARRAPPAPSGRRSCVTGRVSGVARSAARTSRRRPAPGGRRRRPRARSESRSRRTPATAGPACNRERLRFRWVGRAPAAPDAGPQPADAPVDQAVPVDQAMPVDAAPDCPADDAPTADAMTPAPDARPAADSALDGPAHDAGLDGRAHDAGLADRPRDATGDTTSPEDGEGCSCSLGSNHASSRSGAIPLLVVGLVVGSIRRRRKRRAG
jgi:translation initiation factor IF-2